EARRSCNHRAASCCQAVSETTSGGAPVASKSRARSATMVAMSSCVAGRMIEPSTGPGRCSGISFDRRGSRGERGDMEPMMTPGQSGPPGRSGQATVGPEPTREGRRGYSPTQGPRNEGQGLTPFVPSRADDQLGGLVVLELDRGG